MLARLPVDPGVQKDNAGVPGLPRPHAHVLPMITGLRQRHRRSDHDAAYLNNPQKGNLLRDVGRRSQ